MPLDMTPYGLRSLLEQDLALVLGWRNSDRQRLNSLRQNIITIEEHHRWFNNLKSDNTNKVKIFEFKNEPAGVVQFKKIKNGEAFWGFYLGRIDLPKGSGTALGCLGLNYAFEELGLKRVLSEVVRENIDSIKFHQRLGFNQDTAKEEIVHFSITKEQWHSEVLLA